MKKSVVFSLLFLILLGFIGCKKTNVKTDGSLAIPANLNISVTGRLLTITWDPVENASGYIVYIDSVDCNSGKRIINTVTKTVTTYDGTEKDSETAAAGITDKGNGYVTFTSETSFTIWLMGAFIDEEKTVQSDTETMATSIIAKIMAVGDIDLGTGSEYSAEVTLDKADFK